jgi:hypothetical protein
MPPIPKKFVIGGIAAAAIAVTVYWLSDSWLASNPSSQSEANTSADALSTGNSSPFDSTSSVHGSQGSLAGQGGSGTSSSQTPEGRQEVDASMAFAAMAQDYKQLIQYPPYSTPLTRANHDLLNPYEFIATKRPLDNDNQFSFELQLAKYVLFHGAPIPLTLTLQANQNAPLPEVQNLKVELLNAGSVVATIPLALSTNQPKQKIYSANYQPNAADAAQWQTELTIKVSLKLAGKQETGLVESFQYVNPVAKVTGIGSEKIAGAHLLIPLLVESKKAGRFKISANLFTSDNQPISHVNGIFNLTTGKDNAVLRVHADILRAQNAQPPYLLKDITVLRLPDELGGESSYGYAPAGAEYRIKGFPLNLYSLEKYVPEPELLEKAKFLEQLAQPPEDKTN